MKETETNNGGSMTIILTLSNGRDLKCQRLIEDDPRDKNFLNACKEGVKWRDQAPGNRFNISFG